MKRHPLQRPEHFVTGLRSAPWWEPAQFGIVRALERKFPAILNEFDDFVFSGSLMLHPQSAGGPRRALTTGAWNIVDLWSHARLNMTNALRAPVTSSILRNEPAVAGGDSTLAYFSVVAPHSHVEPHCGPTNARIRIHLGLRTTAEARLRVGMETRSWEPGRCLVFDDSWEHEVWNDAETPRSVLLLDIAHPDLKPEQRRKPLENPEANMQPTDREGWAHDDDTNIPEHEWGRVAATEFDAVYALVGPQRAAGLRASIAGLESAPDHIVAAAATCALGAGSVEFDSVWARVPASLESLQRPWESIGRLVRSDEREGVSEETLMDVIRACMIYWRSLPGHAKAVRDILRRWPAEQMRDLTRRLAGQQTLLAMCEFLERYEQQPGAPPFGATAPLLIAAHRAVTRERARRT